MGQRLEFQAILEAILGSKNVYFQPPNGLLLKYPAIVYNLDYVASTFAGNKPYSLEKRYQVTIIDRNPDSATPLKVAALPKSTFIRAFRMDDLNHVHYAVYF